MTCLSSAALQTIPHWHDTIQWGDIVSFRLSHHDNDAQLPPERPWLVVDLNTYVGERYVTLARGHDVGALPIAPCADFIGDLSEDIDRSATSTTGFGAWSCSCSGHACATRPL